MQSATGCIPPTPLLSHKSRGWRGRAPRQPGQVRKEAAVTSHAWVVVQPLTLIPLLVAHKRSRAAFTRQSPGHLLGRFDRARTYRAEPFKRIFRRFPKLRHQTQCHHTRAAASAPAMHQNAPTPHQGASRIYTDAGPGMFKFGVRDTKVMDWQMLQTTACIDKVAPEPRRTGGNQFDLADQRDDNSRFPFNEMLHISRIISVAARYRRKCEDALPYR